MPDYAGRHRPPTRAERRAERKGSRRPGGQRAAYVLPTAAAAAVLTAAGFAATHQAGGSADAAGQSAGGTKGVAASGSSSADTLKERQQERRRAARTAERRRWATRHESEWVPPVEDVPITSEYGYRWGRLHAGRDYGAAMDTPVRAMGDGKVVATGHMAGYGRYIDIQYADGTVSRYGHLSSVDAWVSQWVRSGDVVARSGNSGRSTGPHLHLEIRPDGEEPVDPTKWLSERGID